MAEVIVKNVSKIYPGDVKAVDNITLEIRDREFMVLVGPSGCGKSTTLRMIAGLEEISEGEILIGDRVVNNVPPKDRDIAMVFQNYALYPHMTVFDNMAFGLKLRKFKKAEIQRRVEEAARILGLEPYLDRRPKNLSGGQRQRVAVGRAIVRKPKAFLFDEPLSNLDAKMRVQMRTEISKLHSQLETTMIYVTHDQTEAMTMGDRICVMKDGHIQQIDTPLNLYDNPTNLFVAGFIGMPPMNFFHGIVQSKDKKLYFKEENGFEVSLPKRWNASIESYIDKAVIFGIRPEDIIWQSDAVGENAIEAKVEVIEPMGAETYLYLNTNHHNFIARVDAHNPYKVGEKAHLKLCLEKAHLFDPATEKTIT
ncbi:MAG: sn-glycerol-3-phosphate ABC transporter ATP-binding protein UgpC [Victivallales bacterium]|jgi:multiple sugar transport system ATP-binding protein|nr:sn-glycerol-3-phosphate ABC transporter ATP-binding protein UgpC [Victivallales bacterium]